MVINIQSLSEGVSDDYVANRMLTSTGMLYLDAFIIEEADGGATLIKWRHSDSSGKIDKDTYKTLLSRWS